MKIESSKTSQELKPISPVKFILLCILSFQLYLLWWIYKSWRFFRDKEESDIRPAVRTVFGIIFLIPLFNKILSFAKENGYTKSYNSVLLFIGFIVIVYSVALPDPYWLLAYLSSILLIPPLMALNYGMLHYQGETASTFDNSFSNRQKILVAIGGIFWLLILIGLMMGEEINTPS